MFQVEEVHQSRILLIIVVIFLICSSPRAVLNLVELEHVFRWYVSTDSSASVACYDPPLWSVVLTSVSSFLMTLNASFGFAIYCLMCNRFRSELRRRLRKFKLFRLFL